MASPCPVFPEVGSTIVPPGRRRPSRSAAKVIRRPIRSFTLPPGFSISSLARTTGRIPRVTARRRTSGVCPTASRKESSTCTPPPGVSADGPRPYRLRFAHPRRWADYPAQGPRTVAGVMSEDVAQARHDILVVEDDDFSALSLHLELR